MAAKGLPKSLDVSLPSPTSPNTTPTPTPTPAQTKDCKAGDGKFYRGTVAVTRTGRTCQRWDSQTPHRHSRTPDNYPASGLDQNYCRNPEGEDTLWCYTTDPGKKWEFCDVTFCDAPFALNAAIGVERSEVKIPPFVEPPSVPLQEAVKKKTRRSDLNGPTDHADKPADPDKPSASVRAPGTANTGKPKGTFGGMKSGFLLQKKSQPKTEPAAKADAPKATLPEQQPKNTEARQVKGNISPRQKKADDPPRPKTETGQKQASRPSADSETGQSARPQTPPIYPVLAQLTPILLPVPGTNQATLIWDGSRKARNWLAMIVAARRAAAGL
ncbi:uncharacterized protein LOC144914840 isoform X2 [Branchiostoma floridae x Branchiostoma belcheri]